MTTATLYEQIQRKASYLCVGLDTDPARIPSSLAGESDPIFAFNKAIIDATQDLCVAYKPNLAFYEALGERGWSALRKTVDYIPDTHLTIADAKRGDIGNTARKYAEAFFTQYDFDALTIAPYMGADSVRPFLEYPGKWAILLGLTSNPGSKDFQLQQLQNGQQLFEEVLQSAASWGNPNQLMFVVGATHPDRIEQIRRLVPDHFLLVPGVGAQGGDLAGISGAGLNKHCGLLVNASRSIIYASAGDDYQKAARQAAQQLQREMARHLQSLSISG